VAGAILAAAPDAHTDTLLSGLAALDDELKWFQATAVERGLDLAGTSTLCAHMHACTLRTHLLGPASLCVGLPTVPRHNRHTYIPPSVPVLHLL
jgi:hypothetical protein